jgi:ankyrin repeat protein
MKLSFILVFLLVLNSVAFSQKDSFNEVAIPALKADDTAKLITFANKSNVNECHWVYSLLSHAVRFNALKCFSVLLRMGANPNLICEGYVPPLMHAAKYNRLEMAKMLVAKGADIHYIYNGSYEEMNDAKGMDPLKYAEKFDSQDVAKYLKSLSSVSN